MPPSLKLSAAIFCLREFIQIAKAAPPKLYYTTILLYYSTPIGKAINPFLEMFRKYYVGTWKYMVEFKCELILKRQPRFSRTDNFKMTKPLSKSEGDIYIIYRQRRSGWEETVADLLKTARFSRARAVSPHPDRRCR